MQVKKTAKLDSVGATPSSTSTRKAPPKRGRSPEPTEPVDPDEAQPKSKRSKQAKPAAKKETTKSNSKVGKVDRTKTQPVVTEGSPIAQSKESHPPPPTYTGNFDLYTMDLPFLSKVYLPKPDSSPQFEALYETILMYQAKDDNTAQFFLASPTDATGDSILTSRSILDPMEEFPYDIALESIKHHVSLSLPSNKTASGTTADTPGVTASAALEQMHCGIQSASGAFKLKRVWTKPTSNGEFVELFAGSFLFNVLYGAMYKRKHLGSGQKHNWEFWAVRARTGDDRKEVGLRPMLPVSVRTNAATPSTHPIAAAPVGAGKVGTSGKAASQVLGAPKCSRNFNLYSMTNLIDEGVIPAEPFPSPEDVYKAIADANPSISAKCSLGASVSSFDHNQDDSVGRFRGTSISDPFAEQPYDVVITSIEEGESLSFTEEELGQFPERDNDLSGPGITAQLTLSDNDHPGVVAASGYLKFVRVWAKADKNKGDLAEVFEVYLNLDVSFELSFKLGGRRIRPDSPRETHALAFWAIRVAGDGNGEDWFSDGVSESDCC